MPECFFASHYTHDPAVTLDMVRDALDHHRLAALEARFKADLERHFVKQPFSEIIHSDFVAFDASQEAGRLSQRWLDQAPHSAFALTARGTTSAAWPGRLAAGM
ncbi:hypothetical protein SAMN04487997_0069 [Frateuria terrea]|uniref:Uncharacterized protein n=2 Tax=Frateuria terrea TaxID=529704 RepID=A0A1H6ZRS7_9GAMM|nr:hypothetical protein SAMN04487997_0069 [Frateuria terrea]SFP79466.1 hypothetical protein SAMN02927913_0069 [Frateuria terrea]